MLLLYYSPAMKGGRATWHKAFGAGVGAIEVQEFVVGATGVQQTHKAPPVLAHRQHREPSGWGLGVDVQGLWFVVLGLWSGVWG